VSDWTFDPERRGARIAASSNETKDCHA
jgi:hypothetical protein